MTASDFPAQRQGDTTHLTGHLTGHLAGDWPATVVLEDGGVMDLRPVEPDDREAFLRLQDALSPESKYKRFFSARRELTSEELDHLLHVDYFDRMAIAAVSEGDIVAIGRYDRDQVDRTKAEVAFIVLDKHQGRGIGTLLLEHLAVRALECGITSFSATTMSSNRQMLSVFTHSGWHVDRELDSGYVDLSFPLDAGATDATLERERHADANGARLVLNPRSVALIGASSRLGSIGRSLLENLVDARFEGVIYPVNAKYAHISGLRCYPSISAIPDAVDLAVVAVPASAVAQVIDECGRAGVPAAVVISAGFAEAGAGAAQDELRRIAISHGMRLVGPNCMGVLNTDPGVRLNATFSQRPPEPGSVGFVSQSGALGIALLEQSRRLGLGLSAFVSVGNKIDLSSNDFLQLWESDPNTSVIVLYLESFGNPRKFGRIARRVSQSKPILAVKSGRTDAGRRAAASHTAALAGDDVLVDALCRQTGTIRVDTLEELFDTTRALVHQPLPAGRRIAVVGNSGGPGIMAADAAISAGLIVEELCESTQAALRAVLPAEAAVANPVDVVADSGPREYRRALELVLADENVDAVVVVYTDVTRDDEIIAAIGEGCATSPNKPVLATFLASHVEAPTLDVAPDNRVPIYRYPESPARALANMADLVEWRRLPVGAVPVFDDIDVSGAEQLVARILETSPEGRWLDESELATLLGLYGINVITARRVTSAADAEAVATEVGGPVALKVVSDSIVHKSDVGGVLLDLDPTQAAGAYADMAARLGDAMTGAIIQPMAPKGVEVIVGGLNDSRFGPAVLFGLGGTAAELLADRAVHIAPLRDTDAAALVRGPRSSPLLFGHRGAPPVDTASLEDLVLRVGRLVDDLPQVGDLDLNPVIARPDGISIVDARARLFPAANRGTLIVRRR